MVLSGKGDCRLFQLRPVLSIVLVNFSKNSAVELRVYVMHSETCPQLTTLKLGLVAMDSFKRAGVYVITRKLASSR